MTHYLRNKENKTIIECEVFNDDLSSSVNIDEYSKVLIDLYNEDSHYPFIYSISTLSQIRGWWWEQSKSSGQYKSINDFVKEKFIEVAEKYDFKYVRD